MSENLKAYCRCGEIVELSENHFGAILCDECADIDSRCSSCRRLHVKVKKLEAKLEEIEMRAIRTQVSSNPHVHMGFADKVLATIKESAGE